MPNESPIFFDPRGQRPRWGRRIGTVLGVGLAGLLTVVAISLCVLPFIPNLPGGQKPTVFRRTHPPLVNPHGDEIRTAGYLLQKAEVGLKKEMAASRLRHRPLPKASPAGPIVGAFYAPWEDPAGLASLRAYAKHLTHLFPDWLVLTPDATGLDLSNFSLTEYPHTADVERIAQQNGLLVYPVLSNMVEGTADEKRVAKLLHSSQDQARLIPTIAKFLSDNHFEGLNLDFEALTDADYRLLPAFMDRLHAALAARGLGLSMDLEVSRLPDCAPEVAASDFVVLMNYDEHSEDGDAGPIADLDWFTQNVSDAINAIPLSKLVMGIGNYGYDWNLKNKKQGAVSLSFQDAVEMAREARDDLPLAQRITFDADNLNSTYTYEDDNGDPHEVWLLDGLSAYDEFRVSKAAAVRGEAVWVLGDEDPTIWNFLNRASTAVPTAKEALTAVSFPLQIDYGLGEQEGKGEILQVPPGFGKPVAGTRLIQTDSDGYCVDARYTVYPSPAVINRIGKAPDVKPYVVALTFDDGPDATYTPQILSTLEQLHVPATFFVIGESAISHPGLVRREYDDGDEIGSHTFTHPNMAEVSKADANWQFEATQRAIQSIVGHSTYLFRPPYNADVEPDTPDEVIPVEMASKLGYYTVGESVDPQDWSLQNPDPKTGRPRNRTAQEIAQYVEYGVKTHQGSVVLLHDAGGDRHLTVEALKLLVPKLQSDGYKFVTVSYLLGMTRDQVMPVPTGLDARLLPFERVFVWGWYLLSAFLAIAFVAAIALGVVRIFAITPLAIVANRRQREVADSPDFQPPVTVIIAAYNEEAVIVRTVQSVLGSLYKGLEVIVVDDGSTDSTYDAVSQAFGKNPKVRLLRQENAGKAAALNTGMQVAKGEIYVYLDADTILATDAIRKLVRHFADEKVGAVAGNVKVGNRVNILTRLQAVEYVASQNLDRRAYALMNGITVVPGAIGAWRKTAVEDAGGYTSDTLAEDMDLTWRVRLKHWRIDNESGAIAYTEAPANLKSFFKQRFRWTFGTLQCLFKHRRAIGKNGFFGMLVLPGLWLYQFGLQVIAPFVDIQLVFSVALFATAWVSHSALTKDWRPLPDATQTMAFIGFVYAVFFIIELISAWIAVAMDREKKSLLWWLFLQRLIYRQVLYTVVWKALWTALKGVRTGWGKFERTGTVVLADVRTTRGHEGAREEVLAQETGS